MQSWTLIIFLNRLWVAFSLFLVCYLLEKHVCARSELKVWRFLEGRICGDACASQCPWTCISADIRSPIRWRAVVTQEHQLDSRFKKEAKWGSKIPHLWGQHSKLLIIINGLVKVLIGLKFIFCTCLFFNDVMNLINIFVYKRQKINITKS